MCTSSTRRVVYSVSNVAVGSQEAREKAHPKKSGIHCAESLRSCLTLCDPMDCSLSGSSVHGILQAKVLEWVAMPSSRGSSRPRSQTHISCGSFIVGGFFTAKPPEKPRNLGKVINIRRGRKS